MSWGRGTSVVVGMSGGVDSAVAALLLRRAGCDVQGLYMSNWEEDDAYCSNAQDFQDARAVAEELDIPLHRVSFATEYRDRVFDYFLTEYRAGRTPNPDVLCNREIKFGVCTAHAKRLGAQWFATGHYARLDHSAATPRLLKGVDADKDQSYFLHGVPITEFSQVVFPLGELHKAEVRGLARDAGLPVHDKPDSTGICFIGERPFRDFLAQFVRPQPGFIVTPQGERVGEHQGLAFYTLGQRGGLHVGGKRGKTEAPWFVAQKNVARNELVVVQGHDHPLLSSVGLETAACNWLAAPPATPFDCGVKVRYRQADQACAVTPRSDRSVSVAFDHAQRAVTPGQFAVFYAGEQCLGGGAITVTIPLERDGRAEPSPLYLPADSRG